MTKRPSPLSPERIGDTSDRLMLINNALIVLALALLLLVAGAALARM